QRKLQHDATYSPAQRKLRYSPAQRKLEYIRQKSASAQKIANEQFCNRSTTTSTASTPNQADINLPVEIRESLKHAIKCDQKSMQVEGKVDAFCLPVCLICDRVIIGCETVHKLDKKVVLNAKTKFSVESYNSFYDMELNAELIKQYEVAGLEGLLLSPRATRTTNASTGDVHFSTCGNCYNSMKDKGSDKPPRHAIANGFAIGQVPTRILKNEDITEEMCALLAPVRPYAYLFAYSAGAHKSIRGHYSFFEMDLTHTGSVMNYFLKIGTNPMVYVVLNGRMTPKQKELVRQRAELDTAKMMELLEWFVTESGHPAYANVTPPSECPQPVVMEDEENANNTDKEMDPEVEHTFAGASYHFASNHDPNVETGVYETNQQFVASMLDRTMPTLLVSGGEYANLKELKLENVTPLQFPFGQGGPKQPRRTRISYLECYKLYSRLSLKQFMRADFLLVLNHMHGRLLSFNKAMIKCKSQNCGTTLAEKISTLDINDLNSAMMMIQTGQDPKGTAAEYIKTIKASCEPIGHSAEAAKKNRRRHFALCDYFGESSLFVTTTPCDECSFRVKVFVNAGEEQTLPSLGDLDDEDHIRQCYFDFEVRKRDRTLYPGACSLVYQHLMQIVTECLIGWNTKTKTGRVGVLGKPLAWSRTDEEQARKTLHAHWQIWLEWFNACREALFSDNEEERKRARDTFIEYVDSVICASYPDFTVAHVCEVSDEKETTQILRTQPVNELFDECKDKNILRKARHKDHCLAINGEVLNCKECGKAYSPKQCMEMALAHWRQNSTNPSIEERQQQGRSGHKNEEEEEEGEKPEPATKTYIRRENKDQKVNNLTKELEERGGFDQLLMLLTGGAGCGKSTSVETAQEFAHKFCMAVAIAFNDYTFYFTSTTGSSAAIFGGSTIHGAAHLNRSRLDDKMRQVWREDVKILIIDEISFFK
ncbi:hypothetical protein ACHAXM_002882, partial [Skeletonema potamos]